MKPCEEMHAAVEEVDLDPCDLYTELGTLIVEGRVPGITEKGFGEGPHCVSNSHGQNRHQCDVTSPECQKYDQILKHMLLLWKNGIPMTIEVLLYPSCCAPFQNVDSVPDMPYILLEQWTIHMLPRRVPDASISPRGLLQAVRSFLYFSQLCAWYSLTGGKSPQNVHYRVCVPGEAFSSKFSTQPDCHLFPVANIGRGSAMKVLMKCLPRCGEIPVVPCHRHAKAIANPAKAPSPPYPSVFDGILPAGVSSRTGSPADSMLGESLLDPPNSLCMYPKRYQSPSRCGSPSIEVPEHLMFGSKGVAKREETNVPRRSRPQRRPVVERFLKKDLGNPLCGSPELKARADRRGRLPQDRSPEDLDLRTDRQGRSADILALKREAVMRTKRQDNPPDIASLKRDAVRSLMEDGLQKRDPRTERRGTGPQDIMALKREAVLNYRCIEDSMPREEMDRVLERLRERHDWRKCVQNDPGDVKTDQGKPLEKYFEELKISSGILDRRSRDIGQNYFVKVHNCDDPSRKTPSRQPSWLEGTSKRNCDNSILPDSGENPTQRYPSQKTVGDQRVFKDQSNNNLFIKKLNLQNQSYNTLGPPFIKPQADCVVRHEPQGQISDTYQINCGRNASQHNAHPKCSTVNIKKCGALLTKKTDELTDERELPELDKDNHPPDVFLDDDEANALPGVPSAEKCDV